MLFRFTAVIPLRGCKPSSRAPDSFKSRTTFDADSVLLRPHHIPIRFCPANRQ